MCFLRSVQERARQNEDQPRFLTKQSLVSLNYIRARQRAHGRKFLASAGEIAAKKSTIARTLAGASLRVVEKERTLGPLPCKSTQDSIQVLRGLT